MSNTLRKVIEFPRYMRELSAKVDPLDQELEVIRAVNWELAKLPNDESVIRCMQFLLQHRGFVRDDFEGDLK
jgi:hypothetical protein